MFARKDRKLGVSQGKRVYDLPLNKGEGAGFLILLIALMTFLAVMALAASFALSAMTQRWSSGLENKLTIEVPVESSVGNGISIAHDDVKGMSIDIAAALRGIPAVKSAEILKEKEIEDLISPWLGDDVVLKDIPLPGLISVELHSTTPETLKFIEKRVKDIAPAARLDTHESWLADLLRFTGAMQFAAALITFIIGATTVIAVAGAIRGRMAVHREEVELLHLMGARDSYITRQFQRHAFMLTLQGSLIGTAIGAMVMVLISLISGETAAALIPDFKLSTFHIFMLILLPGFACVISTITARFTVLRALSEMP